jgi:23S rRNA (guanosine2251-2'-O)-methyltransferase
VTHGEAAPRLRVDEPLRAELLAMAADDFAAAERLFTVVEAEPALSDELDARLEDPATPLVTALLAWSGCPPEADDLIALTTGHAERLAAIVAGDGWPGLTRVAADGADAAWIIAQHADAANDLRRPLLEALAFAVETGDADPRHYACLADRIAVVDSEPQRYGTVLLRDEDGRATFPVPVADPAALDATRRGLGLPTIDEEVAELADGDLIPYGADRQRSPLLAWPLVLEGHRSVEAALIGGVRRVHVILATRPGDRRLARMRGLAAERDVPIRAADADLVARLASGTTHGGVVALVGRRGHASLTELIEGSASLPFLVMLDGIEDPHNFGQAIRALYAAGADGLVVRPRTWESATGIVTRASAGASELLPTAVADSVEVAAATCRASGMRVACAASGREAMPLHEADLTGAVLVVIGGERRGITRSFLAACDVRLEIPYGRPEAPPLGTAAAAAVIAFEAARQRSR